MNELGVREISLVIHFKDKKCDLTQPLIISTTLQKYIPNLEKYQ